MDKIEKLTRSKITSENLKYLSFIIYIRLIYEALHSIIAFGGVSNYEKECTSLIETIIEYLLYGDKSDSYIFDTFCEYNFMVEFIKLSSINNRGINLQIIKSFALLITNLTNKQTIFYIFSNNFINQIISNNYDKYDSDFLSYYVNFIKSLTLKLDSLTIQLFFFQQKNEFPLLDNALKLYNHPDPMIINVVRNIFLTILKTKYVPVLDYVCSLPCITYLIFTSCRVRDYIILIDEKLTTDSFDSIKCIYDEVVNDVLFFQDIFSLKIEKINYILTNCLFHYVILPLLCSSLISSKKKTISIYIGLNILIIFAFYIDEEAFLNCLFALLFSEQLHQSLMNKITEEPRDLHNYRFNMEEKRAKRNKEKTFDQFITYNFCEEFIRSIQFMNKSKYDPVMDIVQKLNKLFDNHISGINSNSADLYKIILVELYPYFTSEQNSAMIEYHHIVAISTGISCGLTFRDEKDSAIQRLNKLYKLIKTNPKSSKLVKNDIRENILYYFTSKDDSLILLSGLLINIFLKKKNVISSELFSLNKLLCASDFNVLKNSDSNNNTNSNKNNKLKTTKDDKLDNAIKLTDIVISKKSEQKKKQRFKDINLLNFYSFSLYPKKYDIITLEGKYFNEKFQITQSAYSREIIEYIFSLLDTEIIFRSLTHRVIIEIAESLMLTQGNDHLDIDDVNIRKINKAYITSIMDINRFLKQDQIIISRCFFFFEEEWNKYNSDLLSIIDSLIKEPYMLYPNQYEETLQNFPCTLKTPRTSTDKYSSFLCLFMGLNDFRVKVNNKGSIIKDVFPLKFSGRQAEINERISLKKIPEVFNSKVKKGLGSFINYSMFIIQNYLIFTTPDIKDPNLSIVKQKYPIRQLEIQGDRSEPRNLIVYSREGKRYVEIIISLEDVKIAGKVKSALEEQRKSIEKAEYIMVESYFNEQLKSFEE